MEPVIFSWRRTWVLWVITWAFFSGLTPMLSRSRPSGQTAGMAVAITHSVFIAGPDFTGILDEHGEVTWAAPRAGARDGWVLPGGEVLVAWADEVLEFDVQREVRWRYALASENREIGTVQRLPNGNTLVTELGPVPRLLEVTPAGELAVEVALQPETDNAHMQTRMARKLADGTYLVPHLLAHAVKRYDRSGEVLEVLRTDLAHLGGRAAENWPFTAIRLECGNTLIGCTHGNRVVELDPQGQVAWELSNEDVGGIIVDACGVQRLPNGHTVVASYGAQEGVRLFEVNLEKRVVWTYRGPHRVHHFQILSTQGQPLTAPALR